MAKAAKGAGNIRKKTVTRSGKSYTYWEARITTGRDPGTGKQIQRSITGKTQKEVSQRLRAATTAIDVGDYTDPCRMTVGQWLDIWAAEYLGGVKPRTVDSYRSTVRNHLKPTFGAVRLDALTPHMVQSFYNGLELSPKTVKNIHGVLHKALQQAVVNHYIGHNPADVCILPRITKREIKPLDEKQISDFLAAIRGHRFENLYITALFTGMRESELLGLSWDAIDFEKGTIFVNRQLQRNRDGSGTYGLAPTKNGKGRRITLAKSVISTLKQTHKQQLEWRLQSMGDWDNPMNLVFTDQSGHWLSAQTVYLHFKKIADAIGAPDARFHDLRHTYAVASIRSGDDIKTVQENLGHATAAFTLDIYGHVTEQMKQSSAERMERFIKSVAIW